MIERRLQPYVDELYEWAFRRFAQQCKQRGIHPLVIYRPAPVDFEWVGTGRAKRSDSPGTSCRTRSHRPLARFRFGDESQYTDHRQMGRSHYGAWSPAACGQTVPRTRAAALWFVPLIFRFVLPRFDKLASHCYYRYVARKYEPRFRQVGLFFKQGFGLTRRFNMKLAEDDTSLVLFIVAAPMFMRPCDADPYVAKWLRLTSKRSCQNSSSIRLGKLVRSAALRSGNEL